MIKDFLAAIGQHLVNFFHLFFYTAGEYSDLKSERDALELDNKNLNAMYKAQVQRSIALEEEQSAMIKKLDETKKDLMSKLNDAVAKGVQLAAENARILEGTEVDKEYLRDVQKQLAEEFNMHPVFGFPRSPGLPGSVSMDTCRTGVTESDPGFVVHRGRVILDDHETQQINRAHHMYDKCQIVLNHLRRYGSLERIIENMISNGAMSMTLAYRDETTTYEMFYEITAKSHFGDSILVFDDKTGCVVKREEENGEG